jgi:hypothetical protein
MPVLDKEYFLAGLQKYAVEPENIELINTIFHGPFKLSKIAGVLTLVQECVQVVEKMAADAGEIGAGTGKAKKDAIIHFLDEATDLPWYIDKTGVDSMIISGAIDAVVTWFNTKIGKDWIIKIKSIM